MYTEMECIKSDSAEAGSASAERENIDAVKLNGSEWQESIEKLAGEFGNAKGGDALGQIKTGVLSPLQQNEGHYYAVAVMKNLGEWAHRWCWWLSNCRCRDHIARRY
jgi:hypothetical protein